MKNFIKVILILISIVFFTSFIIKNEWGFFGHMKINRMAVYTLPPEMMYFFKPNIEFFTEHGPDPDKRKYIDPHEAIKHYIDIDYWGEYPFPDLPRTWNGVMYKYAEIYSVNDGTKSLLFGPEVNEIVGDTIFGNNVKCSIVNYKSFINTKVASKIINEELVFSIDSFLYWLNVEGHILDDSKIEVIEHFSKEGILPYHLYQYYFALVHAFEDKNPKSIIRRANDMGHYMADAHVPLHTTKNYNGQLTGQVGIHAFWENRIPELLCDEEFDFFVGKAEYVENVRDFFWRIILKSHSLKDRVLAAEKRASLLIPDDKKFVFAERNGVVTKLQSEEYTRAFNKELNGMVEMRMRDVVKALGDIWYTAWIDAGQPNLKDITTIKWTKKEREEMKKVNSADKNGKMFGRDHWD